MSDPPGAGSRPACPCRIASTMAPASVRAASLTVVRRVGLVAMLGLAASFAFRAIRCASARPRIAARRAAATAWSADDMGPVHDGVALADAFLGIASPSSPSRRMASAKRAGARINASWTSSCPSSHAVTSAGKIARCVAAAASSACSGLAGFAAVSVAATVRSTGASTAGVKVAPLTAAASVSRKRARTKGAAPMKSAGVSVRSMRSSASFWCPGARAASSEASQASSAARIMACALRARSRWSARPAHSAAGSRRTSSIEQRPMWISAITSRRSGSVSAAVRAARSARHTSRRLPIWRNPPPLPAMS